MLLTAGDILLALLFKLGGDKESGVDFLRAAHKQAAPESVAPVAEFPVESVDNEALLVGDAVVISLQVVGAQVLFPAILFKQGGVSGRTKAESRLASIFTYSSIAQLSLCFET